MRAEDSVLSNALLLDGAIATAAAAPDANIC
jgi:hypothetical protein